MSKINWRIVFITLLIIGLIILNRIPYTYREVSSSSIDCYWECYPDKFSSYQEEINYSHTEEVYGWENNALVKSNKTFNESYISTTCKCQTSVLKKSISWILNNQRYD